MTREKLLKELEKIPKVETNKPISTMNAINVDDLMNAVDRLNKIPDYNDLLKENQELKKQVEETDRKLFFTKNELDMREKTIDNKLIQQKEFIKYLEDMLDDENDIFSVARVKDVLRKYKEITGVEK